MTVTIIIIFTILLECVSLIASSYFLGGIIIVPQLLLFQLKFQLFHSFSVRV